MNDQDLPLVSGSAVPTPMSFWLMETFPGLGRIG
jgi:hypothetical protein